jgi:hypothetical protein
MKAFLTPFHLGLVARFGMVILNLDVVVVKASDYVESRARDILVLLASIVQSTD